MVVILTPIVLMVVGIPGQTWSFFVLIPPKFNGQDGTGKIIRLPFLSVSDGFGIYYFQGPCAVKLPECNPKKFPTPFF